MESKFEVVCVTGAAGFIGSWLVMRLLERGYVVRATVRDPSSVSLLCVFVLSYFCVNITKIGFCYCWGVKVI